MDYHGSAEAGTDHDELWKLRWKAWNVIARRRRKTGGTMQFEVEIGKTRYDCDIVGRRKSKQFQKRKRLFEQPTFTIPRRPWTTPYETLWTFICATAAIIVPHVSVASTSSGCKENLGEQSLPQPNLDAQKTMLSIFPHLRLREEGKAPGPCSSSAGVSQKDLQAKCVLKQLRQRIGSKLNGHSVVFHFSGLMLPMLRCREGSKSW